MVTELAQLIADVRDQVLYMHELGVEVFDVELSAVSGGRSSRFAEQVSEIPTLRSATPASLGGTAKLTTNPISTERPAAGSRLSALPSLSKRPSAAPMPVRAEKAESLAVGNQVTQVTTEQEKLTVLAPNIEKIPGRISLPVIAMAKPKETIEQIRAEIGPDCTRCKLCEARKQVVNSTGNFNAELMFVGEAPGADEDEQGLPFVGRAGQLLTKIIESIGVSREDVFIGNINRCRPPGNRAPEPDETISCKPFLQREIAVVRPKVIVVLGATAAHNLLETKVPIGKLRGQFHDYLGTKVMPTFHPAYLLRDPHKKREVWDDMKMVRDYLNSVA